MVPIYERFTERARQVVVLAQDEARLLKHNFIGTEHILLGLLREEEGLASRVLESLGITVVGVRAQIEEIVGEGESAPVGQIQFTPRGKKVLELSLREALSLGHNYIGTEHILLGLVRENEGVAARILLDYFDADAEKIRNEIIRILSGPSRRQEQESVEGEARVSRERMRKFSSRLRGDLAEWWWENPSHQDLTDVHHALRLVAMFPGLSDEEVARYKALADGIWEGYFVARAKGEQ